MIAMVTTA